MLYLKPAQVGRLLAFDSSAVVGVGATSVKSFRYFALTGERIPREFITLDTF